ncbi:hypothetical protein [Saccharospirillum salsuginis]|uniref:FlgD Ig-like domain-containing protein n=1 Tax=Saccharospirillum salsuginis TaxID=418750 RepID=A0A918KJ96_9GAMM|nr:hypothetical protein [Saccharospirillum salsuginis]GGX65947.1 hypothetical protein GCM10007392_36950 [Saccharospirillum salsuginis]
MIHRVIVAVIGLGMSLNGLASVGLQDYERHEFNPSRGQTFEIPVEIEQTGRVEVRIFSADGDRVRTLSSDQPLDAGIHRLTWDGKDSEGSVVPNEAFVPVLSFKPTDSEAESQTYDPRTFSGGEEIRVNPRVESSGRIVFELEQPARILARAGVRSGPMMAPILNWGVRGPGRNVINWNGQDRDNLVDLIDHEQLALLVTGFELPRHSILTTGNRNLDYTTWRQNHGWTSQMPDFSQVPLERDGRRISRHYYLPRSVDIDPRVTLDIRDDLPVNEAGIPVVTGPVSLRVGMHEDDRWAMQQSLYEVAFFVDQTFVSEEEQGYVPLTWRWNPAGLSPGMHLVTVNISGFNGQVGVRSLRIFIPE